MQRTFWQLGRVNVKILWLDHFFMADVFCVTPELKVALPRRYSGSDHPYMLSVGEGRGISRLVCTAVHFYILMEMFWCLWLLHNDRRNSDDLETTSLKVRDLVSATLRLWLPFLTGSVDTARYKCGTAWHACNHLVHCMLDTVLCFCNAFTLFFHFLE